MQCGLWQTHADAAAAAKEKWFEDMVDECFEGRSESFASEKAFTMHCQRSPIRFNFIRDAVRGIGSITTSQAIDVLEQNATLVINPVITSLKRASVLRCDVINEQNVGNDTAVGFSSSNVDTDHDDHIDEPNMANKYNSDDNKWKGIAIPLPPTPPPLSTQPVMTIFMH